MGPEVVNAVANPTWAGFPAIFLANHSSSDDGSIASVSLASSVHQHNNPGLNAETLAFLNHNHVQTMLLAFQAIHAAGVAQDDSVDNPLTTTSTNEWE